MQSNLLKVNCKTWEPLLCNSPTKTIIPPFSSTLSTFPQIVSNAEATSFLTAFTAAPGVCLPFSTPTVLRASAAAILQHFLAYALHSRSAASHLSLCSKPTKTSSSALPTQHDTLHPFFFTLPMFSFLFCAPPSAPLLAPNTGDLDLHDALERRDCPGFFSFCCSWSCVLACSWLVRSESAWRELRRKSSIIVEMPAAAPPEHDAFLHAARVTCFAPFVCVFQTHDFDLEVLHFFFNFRDFVRVALQLFLTTCLKAFCTSLMVCCKAVSLLLSFTI